MKAGGALIASSLLGWTSLATAQPAARFALSWDAPPGCPAAEDIQARVGALLGEGATAGTVADVRASGQVERVNSSFRLMLAMGVGNTASSRVIEARTCDELAGAAAIAIALLARSTFEDPAGGATTDEGPSPAAAGNEAAAPPVPVPRPGSEPRKPATPSELPPDRWHLVLDAPVGVVGWGSLPDPGFGLGGAVGLRWKRLRVTVGAELWQPQTNNVAGFESRFTLQSARGQACLTQPLLGWEVGPCLGGAMQRLSGEGRASGVFSATSRAAVWYSGTAGIFASVATPGFQHLRFFGMASVLVSPSRPRFVIDQLGAVHEPALAAPRLDLGCEWIF